MPLPQPTRHRVRARQDFEDSITAELLESQLPNAPARRSALSSRLSRSRVAAPQNFEATDFDFLGEPTVGKKAMSFDQDLAQHQEVPASTGRVASLAAVGVILVFLAWEASIRLPQLLERLLG